MNAITQQLADAVRLNLAGHFSVQKQTEALAAYDAAKDAPDARDAEIAALKHDLERTRGERNRVRLEEEKKWKVKP